MQNVMTNTGRDTRLIYNSCQVSPLNATILVCGLASVGLGTEEGT